MSKDKTLNIIVLALMITLILSVLFIGYLTYKIVFPKEEVEIEINYSELDSKDLLTVTLSEPVTTNLKIGEDGKDYFAIVGISYEVATIYEEESEEIINILAENEFIIRSIVTEVVRNKTYEEMLSNEIYEELSNEILLKMQEEFDSKLICNVIVYSITVG